MHLLESIVVYFIAATGHTLWAPGHLHYLHGMGKGVQKQISHPLNEDTAIGLVKIELISD